MIDGSRIDTKEGVPDLEFAPISSPHVSGVEEHARDVDEAGVIESVQHRRVRRPHTPARDQIRNRRCAADFDIPKHGGRPRQAQPLIST